MTGGRRKMSYAIEVLSRIDITPEGCWRWTGYRLPQGYGQIGKNLLVHRVAWEHLRGPIPEGMTLDHECHNRDETCNLARECPHRVCVNPDHIAVKTVGDNAMAGRTPGALNVVKTHCLKGHEFTEENTYYRPARPGRICRTCRYEIGVRIALRDREKRSAAERERRRRLRGESVAS